MEIPEKICVTLAQAYGTSQYWKIYPDLLITDSVKLIAEMCNAYLLLHDTFIQIHDKALKLVTAIIHAILLSPENASFPPIFQTNHRKEIIILTEKITIRTETVSSDDRFNRYLLHKERDNKKPEATIIMTNPSAADLLTVDIVNMTSSITIKLNVKEDLSKTGSNEG